MTPSQSKQLENAVDEALKRGNVQALHVLLQRDIYEEIPMKCSQQFLTKLDKFVSRSLDQKDAKSARLGLASLFKCGKNLKLPDGQGLSGLIAQGLIKKWFEKCRQLWIQCGLQWDETLFVLSEDLLNALTVVHEACKEGTLEITECFLYPIGQLAVDPAIYILIKKEAVRKFNLILDKIPVELKTDRKILTSQEASDLMMKLAGQILEGGDYDFQSSLMEALCRMATPNQRKELADRWFSMGHVASAFAKIHDSEFETACRKFLNMVNGMQGDRRRVYSYPCLEVYLGKYELLMPSDENLEEFWIDFNLGSHSISFYFSLIDEEAQEGHWETICIHENEVQSYTVTAEGKRQVLQVKLSEVVIVGAVEGSSLTIHFSSSLDILQAARNVYGLRTNKGTSEANTTIKTITEVNSTQIVPESQMSLDESEKSTAPYLFPTPATYVQMVTPAKTRMSESTTLVCCSAVGSAHSSSSVAVMLSNTPAKSKDKPSLQMVRSRDATVKTCSSNTTLLHTNAVGMEEKWDTSKQSTASKQIIRNKTDKHKKSISVAEAVDLVLAGEGEEKSQEHSFVPDTQPRNERNVSSSWSKLSVSEALLMSTSKNSSLPRPESHSSLVGQQDHRPSPAQRWSVSNSSLVRQKELHIELTKRLQQVLEERNQDPALQEPAAHQRKMSNVRGDSKDRSLGEQHVSSLCIPKVQQTQRSCSAKGKSKSQTTLKTDAVTVKAKERIPTQVEVETKRTFSSKEKRDVEVAGSMVKLISSHYEIKTQSTNKGTAENNPPSWSRPLVNRPIFNTSWLPTAKRETPGAAWKKNSVFDFNVDAPLSVRGENKTFTTTSAMSSSSGIHTSSLLLSTTKKGQPVAKSKRYVKKHLFSDTDTDNAQTEHSWLRESSRKPKPKVTKYSRQGPIKPKAVPLHTSYESPESLQPSPKAVADNTKTSKKPYVKQVLDKPKKTVKPAAAPSRPHAAGRRPKRAAATSTKSYREPDTDDSQSEPEKPPRPKNSSTDNLKNTEEANEISQMTKKTTTACKQPTKSYMKLVTESVSEKQPPSKKYFLDQQGKSEKTWSEVPEVKKRKNMFSEQYADSFMREDSNKQSELKKTSALKQQRPGNVLQETSKLNKKNVISSQEQMSALKDSWAACQTSFCPSPPFIEKMRSAERSAPTLDLTCSPVLSPQGSPLPASPNPLCQDTPSPILLLPKPHSTVSSKGNCKVSSFYSAEKKCSSSKTRSIHSLHSLPLLGGQTLAPSPPTRLGAAEVCTVKQHLSSAAQSPLSLSTLPLLTSTLVELDKPPLPSPAQSPFPEDSINCGHHSGFSKVSSASLVSLRESSTKSLVLSSGVKGSPAASLAASHKTEKTPQSDRDLKRAQLHMSGPSRKRHISSSSDSEEDEKEERKKSKMREQCSVRMKPRKLFKSPTRRHGQAQSWGQQQEDNEENRPKGTLKVIRERMSEEYKNSKDRTVRDTTHGKVAEVSGVDEFSQVMSYSQMSSSHWEAGVVDGDVDIDIDMDEDLPECAVTPSSLCHKLSSELNTKFQNRYKVEVYNKQSLKTIQQHVSSINKQVTKHRTERLEHLQKVLLEEIHKLEQDDTVLKGMEKDLALYWKKQTLAFHSHQEQETQRNETLKRALHSNTCHSLEYEERIFTSQMCLIRKGMKSVQDRLLGEMLEGEIQSVKRGLHALFFP